MFIFLSDSGLFVPEASGKLHGDKDNLELELRSTANGNQVSVAFDPIGWLA